MPQSTTPWIYSYYAYDANGQVMSTYTVTLNGTTQEAAIDEQLLYGSGRIGVIRSGELIYSSDRLIR